MTLIAQIRFLQCIAGTHLNLIHTPELLVWPAEGGASPRALPRADLLVLLLADGAGLGDGLGGRLGLQAQDHVHGERVLGEGV